MLDEMTIDHLPESVATKLRRLRVAAEDAYAPLRNVIDSISDVRIRKQRLESGLRQYLAGALDGRRHDAQDRHAVTDQAAIDRLGRELAALNDRHEALSARWHEAARPTDRCESYLRGIPTATCRAAPPTPAPPIAKGESFVDAVDRVRREIERLRREVRTIHDAQAPAAEAKAKARAEIEALAARGRPNVMPLLESDRTAIAWASGNQVLQFVRGGDLKIAGTFTVEDHVGSRALIAWLFRDELVAALEREIDEKADSSSAISTDDRPARLAKLRQRLLGHEREEEALIEAAAAIGLQIPRREDADPRAVLGLADDMPAPDR